MKPNKVDRKTVINIVFSVSVGILIILLTIQNIRLNNYINETRNFILDELEVMDVQIEQAAECPYKLAIDNMAKRLLKLETKMNSLPTSKEVDLTDIIKDIDRLEERITDLENGG